MPSLYQRGEDGLLLLVAAVVYLESSLPRQVTRTVEMMSSDYDSTILFCMEQLSNLSRQELAVDDFRLMAPRGELLT